MGRPKNTQERRQQIIAGMTAVVAREGYDGASISEIARAAGLTQGLVHYHFATKLEIFLSLIESLGEAVKERVRRHVDEASTPRAKVDAFIDAHLAVNANADPQLVACWAVIGAEAVRQPQVREAFQQVVAWEHDTLEQLVLSCFPADRRNRDRARSCAAGLFAAIQGYFVLAAASPQSTPPGSAASTVRSMAHGLLTD